MRTQVVVFLQSMKSGKYLKSDWNTLLYATNSAQIGKGSFATVKKAYERSSGIPRAIKQIAKHKFAMNQKTLKMFEREIGIIKILDHVSEQIWFKQY